MAKVTEAEVRLTWSRTADVVRAVLTIADGVPGWYSVKAITDHANKLRPACDPLHPRRIGCMLRKLRLTPGHTKYGAQYLVEPKHFEEFAERLKNL